MPTTNPLETALCPPAGAALQKIKRASMLPLDDVFSGLTRSAADKLDRAAGYFRSHELPEIIGEVRQFVRRAPGQALLAAAVAGFVVGSLSRRE